MLKVRVIPTLLWNNVGLVKGVGFDSWRQIDTVMPAIKVYNTRDVDELILLDITATQENRDLDYQTIEEFSSELKETLTQSLEAISSEVYPPNRSVLSEL